MSSHLVQKTIVDRRGITTTKWVRPEFQTNASTSISPLALHAQDVATAVMTFEPPHDSREYSVWSSQKVLIRYHLESSTHAYVRMVNELGNKLSGEGMGHKTKIAGRAVLARFLERGKTDVVRALGAHCNLIDGAYHRTKQLCQLFEALLSNGITSPNPDGSIPTLEAHLAAQSHYEKARLSRTAYALIPSYEKNAGFMQMVEDHSDHIEHLLNYRNERALDTHPDGPQPLDEDDFRDYLKNGILASGTL